ncbi:hypothetical protein GCM10023317_38700 [Actinopolymorpha pittospori]|uniref:Uncharacterized protein n=1 Tax=Actinopolymorpha pittospori TaxID=648752 RepID=A0A927R6E0_9ACTN|nr:hypothetical protein [Actinopolymorpha pittospori]
MTADPQSNGQMCSDPACEGAGYHRHWVDPGHALAACLFDIVHGGPPSEADLAALPPGWRRLVRSVQKRCEHSHAHAPADRGGSA